MYFHMMNFHWTLEISILIYNKDIREIREIRVK